VVEGFSGTGGESVGALLARVRVAQGRSQLRVAELLCAVAGTATVTRHEVSRWEREERIPSTYWLRWLAVVLDVPLGELERAAREARHRRSSLDEPDEPDEVDSNPPAGQEAPGRPGGRARLDAGRSPGTAPPVVAVGIEPVDLRSRVAELRRMDDLLSGAEMVDAVFEELRAAAATLDPAPGRSRRARERLRLAADLGQLAAWVAADAGDDGASLRAHRTALRTAQAADDQPLAGHILGCHAQLAAEDGEPHIALPLARRAAARAAPTSSARTRALQCQRIGYAAAIAGERRRCEEALLAAERAFARGDAARDPEWLYWFDEIRLTSMAGRCYAALGRPALARPLLTTALDSGRLRQRGWALCASALVRAHVDAGDLDAACALAGETLLMCVRGGSVRAMRHLRQVEPSLRRAGGHAALHEYEALAAECRLYLPADGAGFAREASSEPAGPSGSAPDRTFPVTRN
jgi:transcriptional regulator with XRE-family HTH domain